MNQKSECILRIWLAWSCAVAVAIFAGVPLAQGAAPATPQGVITGKAFTGIPGTAVANLTGSPNFPDSPDAIMFLPWFEWNAGTDIFTAPLNWGDNYGTQIKGYFYPPATGSYVFYLASDDNSVLYLSTDGTEANKKLIAQETVWSNPREYFTSGGGSVLTSKDSSQFTGTEWPTTNVLGGADITLQANQPYYIEALHKEGNGGDNLSVSIDGGTPIAGQYLSSDRTNGPVTIAVQPQSQSVDERGSVTFSVLADGTPPYTYQWRTNGTDVTDATNLTYTVTNATTAYDGVNFSAVVTGQGNITSSNAVLTVIPDTIPPVLLGAKGNLNLTEVVLTFSEAITQASATTSTNYQINSAGGALAVTAASLSPGGTVVTLTTDPQTLGTKYTVTVQNVQDTAATPNTIDPNSKAVFFPKGKLIEQNGFIVFEAENYDRNLDGLWLPDTTRGTPSGGVSMVVTNGSTGGGEFTTQLEYDVDFAQAATYQVWYRASANDGGDDSGWFHLDGALPVERDPALGAPANSASMTGFQPQADFVWRSDSQGGPDPFTVAIPSAGPHIVGLGLREDGAFFDKFILTTDTTFTPTGFGPPETRQGAPAAPTVALTAPTDGQTFAAGGNIDLTATATGDAGLAIVRVEFTANGNVIGEATNSPFSFTWTSVPDGIYAVRATATDEIGGSTTTAPAVINVGTPPPQALLLVGTASDPVLNPSDAGAKARLESLGWQVTVVQAPASVTTDGDGKQLIVISATVNSGDVGDKFRTSSVPVLMWEQAVQDNFLMTLDTATDHNTSTADQTQLNIVKNDHPLAAGLSLGLTTVTTNVQAYGWGVPNANAVIIATLATNSSQAVIYGYDKDAILIDGTTPAPARRVMFFPGNDGFDAFTPDALKLFDAAVEWASGITIEKTSAKIAWVSFHSADDTPSVNAAAAGFTNAPDIGYTDLLTANGHKVTRFVTSGTPDSAVLNAFDLVIISRSVPSGDYQAASATAAWSGLTAPTMILGGYVLRNSRLGFTTGGTIPDTAGPVQLTVNDPNHPIFAGIALDAGNTMVNTYADLVTYNGTVQRGISVNTDPVAGAGTVLATIGTATDPAFGGMVIGEWQAGDTMANATTNILGGHRLVFLTGSREQGITSEGAGIYDLGADGAKMFLNAVNYMAGTVPGNPRPTLSLARDQTGISITFTGALESAPSVTGPWTDVQNATSPYAVTPSGTQLFYRAKQ